MENNIDRRVMRTKTLLIHSLSTLMKQKNIKDITVKELCELADINRGTFYLHYKDIYDMLALSNRSIATSSYRYFKNIMPGIQRIFLILYS